MSRVFTTNEMEALLRGDLYHKAEERAEPPFAIRYEAPGGAFRVEYAITRARKHDSHPDWLGWRQALARNYMETGEEGYPDDIERNADGKPRVVVICRVLDHQGEEVAKSPDADERWLEDVLP
jgi:hypothetical protein